MRRLRVVTYNVQRWHDFDAILATLERLKPEVLALNEVHAGGEHADALETVRSRLAMASAHFFGHALDGAYGNAVLTRAASTAVARRHLAGGSVVRGPLNASMFSETQRSATASLPRASPVTASAS